MNQIPECFYRVSTKALVLDETRTKFLLLREDNDMRDFPGGGLDFGENPRDGIIREIKEETGLETVWVDTRPAYFVTAERPEKHCSVAHIYYETKLKNLEFTPSNECQEVRFVTREEAEKLSIYPQVAEFLKQFIPG